MGVENANFSISVKAQESLVAAQYHAFAFDDGKLANNGKEASGIIMGKPASGDHAQVGILGALKFAAGAAVAAGAMVAAVTSGWFITAESGYHSNGRAVEAVTSGSVGFGIFNFANTVYQVSSL